MICTDIPQPLYFLFSDSVPQLLYYSHIPTMLVTLAMGSLILIKNKSVQGNVLFMISLFFSIWIFFNLILWTNINGDLIVFLFSLYGFIQPFIFLLAIYFTLIFIKRHDLGFTSKLILFLPIVPLIIFSGENLAGFNLDYCEAYEGSGWYYYYFYLYEIIIFITIFIYGLYSITKEKTKFKRQIILLLIGIEFFLVSFFTAGFLASYLAEQGYEKAFEVEQYGLFGMTFFMGVLAYIIVKFKAFNIKLIGAQALVVALWFLVGSLLFVAQSTQTRVVAGVTLTFTTIAGYFLVRSVKKEVAQREQIEGLVVDLNKANERLKILDKMKSEFVSIASHQLRSPLTSIRGYASMLVEGTYGKLPEKAVDVLKNISDSARFMAQSVEDYLNVSRIEAGNMKYELSDFSLKEQAEKIVDEMRQVVMKAGLVLLFRSENTGSMIVHADIGKTRQVINNIIDNAMKYTPHGTITVIAHDDIKQKKAIITIQDTGIGMDEDTRNDVFNKFVRAKNANSVNTSGTGLGLYVAKIMVEEMGGTVWAESEGQGKGSVFHIELPLV